MFKCLNLNAIILPEHSDVPDYYPYRSNNKFKAPNVTCKNQKCL